MSKTFRPWNPEQTLLLPPSPVDWLPENHLVFFLLDLIVKDRTVNGTFASVSPVWNNR